MYENMEGTAPEDKVVQPETDFAEFYCGVISKLYDLKCRQISKDVETALRNVRRLNRKDIETKHDYFSFKMSSVRCAYMYAYSVLHSVILYSEFLKYLELNKRYIYVCPDSLNICCLGGGPGTEAVAIYKSIYDFACKSSAESDESILEVKVTVIDKLPHWKREDTAVMNAINDKSNVLHSKKVIFHFEFIKADILEPFDTSVKQKIKEADFVTIIKIGNYIKETHTDDCYENLQNMLRNVVNSMDDCSSLFMLDKAGGNVFYRMKNVLQENTGTSLLRRSDHKEYRLDHKTVNKLRDLMRYNDKCKQPILPTSIGKVSSCLWIKNAIPANEITKISGMQVSMKKIKKNSKNPCSSNSQSKENSSVKKRDKGVAPESVVRKKKPKERMIRDKKITTKEGKIDLPKCTKTTCEGGN